MVDAASPRRLVAALRPLINNLPLRHQLGAAGRDLAERKHDAARNNGEIFGLMHQAAEKRRRIEPSKVDTVMESA